MKPFFGLESSQSRHRLVRALIDALLVVVPTYILATFGAALSDTVIPSWLKSMAEMFDVADTEKFFSVLIFTVLHGIAPIFLYYFMLRPGRDLKEVLEAGNIKPWRHPVILFIFLFFKLGTIFTHFYMLCWYSFPIILLASLTSWMSLPFGIIHVLLAGHGRRRWVFLEHGATSMALLLFILAYSRENFFPAGLLIAIIQALILTLAEWSGKELWISGKPAVTK